MIAWFAIVFTGKYPEGSHNFNAGYLRMIEGVAGFEYSAQRRVAPVRRRRGPAVPVRIGVAPTTGYVQPAQDRASPDRRDSGLSLRSSGDHPECLALIAWFAILFTGRLPEGLFAPALPILPARLRII